MSIYYPEGVTGMEPEIAGPDHEEEIVADCDACGYSGYVTVATFGYRRAWSCPRCYAEHEGSVD